ncbi:MAG: UDP-N-acetylmuramate--L-alanine ligase [Bacteroidia bacterium]
MRIHLIAIGGSAMHNMALSLHKKGYKVSGSDDEINEPSKSRLAAAGILPEKTGWFPEKITGDIDAVILGMHAREENPELIRARELGLKIYSYPEYIYEQTKDKIRVVIGGSHGKTTITAMILHVLNFLGKDCDYMVGAQLDGFDTMVKLSAEATIAVIEGDEYLASPIDRRPKFHLYRPNVALLSGIAWDHINVFPTFEIYVEQFVKFIELVEEGGSLVYCETDEVLKNTAEHSGKPGLHKFPYGIPGHIIEKGITSLIDGDQKIPLKIFGDHNLMNLNGARIACGRIGVEKADFYRAIQSFRGASKRLEYVAGTDDYAFYKDFAHSPSKLKATIHATKKQFPERKLIACMELHTFSSLNENFLNEYKGAMAEADDAIVYYNPHTIEHKKLKAITKEQVEQAFEKKGLKIFTESAKVVEYLEQQKWSGKNLLMMSSGNFDGIDFKELSSRLKT